MPVAGSCKVLSKKLMVCVDLLLGVVLGKVRLVQLSFCLFCYLSAVLLPQFILKKMEVHTLRRAE